jgi:hypothetical protein
MDGTARSYVPHRIVTVALAAMLPWERQSYSAMKRLLLFLLLLREATKDVIEPSEKADEAKGIIMMIAAPDHNVGLPPKFQS